MGMRFQDSSTSLRDTPQSITVPSNTNLILSDGPICHVGTFSSSTVTIGNHPPWIPVNAPSRPVQTGTQSSEIYPFVYLLFPGPLFGFTLCFSILFLHTSSQICLFFVLWRHHMLVLCLYECFNHFHGGRILYLCSCTILFFSARKSVMYEINQSHLFENKSLF